MNISQKRFDYFWNFALILTILFLIYTITDLYLSRKYVKDTANNISKTLGDTEKDNCIEFWSKEYPSKYILVMLINERKDSLFAVTYKKKPLAFSVNCEPIIRIKNVKEFLRSLEDIASSNLPVKISSFQDGVGWSVEKIGNSTKSEVKVSFYLKKSKKVFILSYLDICNLTSAFFNAVK